jgi:23S rRNA (uridine2552-2'-O)-methyltransferase
MRPEEAKRDHYRKQARRLGYRSRAAFKLLEINRSYHVFNDDMYIIDLGCSPGGWLQVALQFIDKGKMIGIDTRSIKPLPGVEFINASIDDPDLSSLILERFGRRADLILSDMAPNISGIWSLDHLKQIDLVYKALDLADKVLKKNGSMVCKVFEGEATNQLRADLNKRFKKVSVFKPKASRKASSEIYFICFDFQ